MNIEHLETVALDAKASMPVSSILLGTDDILKLIAVAKAAKLLQVHFDYKSAQTREEEPYLRDLREALAALSA